MHKPQHRQIMPSFKELSGAIIPILLVLLAIAFPATSRAAEQLVDNPATDSQFTDLIRELLDSAAS